jgi:Meiosis protein SPO22/ZIP4 like
MRRSAISKSEAVSNPSKFTLTPADLSKGNERLIRVGLAAAKLSLSSCMHDLASRILGRVAVYLEKSSKCASPGRRAGEVSLSHLHLQYSTLRMTLVRPNPFMLTMTLTDSSQSWQQNRLDLAEHFFAMVDLTHFNSAPADAEILIDLLFEIGKYLFDQGCCDMAVMWLERAHQLLESQDVERLSSDAGELRLNVLHTYGWL